MTARIKLIVTGETEELALHDSLKRFFPAQRKGQTVEWDMPRRSNGATSNRLQALVTPNGAMKKLARIMINEAMAGKHGRPADLIILVDDVELGNVGQEVIVAQHFRSALQQELTKYSGSKLIDCQNILRNNCSFHLLKPMLEAYFFGGDENALQFAGVPLGIQPLLTKADVEAFEANDDDYRRKKCWGENLRKQQNNNPWWREECHPKHYLEYLVKQGNSSRSFYEETNHGRNALKTLDWPQVPIQQTDTPMVRSLFADISDWFEIPNPVPGYTNSMFYPTPHANLTTRMLRNL